MWNKPIRPYGEYFASNQAITTSVVVGNVAANQPTRLDQAQGGTAIVVAVAKGAGKTLVVASAATITLTIQGAKTAAGTYYTLGTAVYTNDTGAAITLGEDTVLTGFVLNQASNVYPYVKASISGSAAPTGTIDIFPAYISAPRG